MTNHIRIPFLLLFSLSFGAAACVEPKCPVGTYESGGRCLEGDGGMDCAATCSGATPNCDRQTGTCVGCASRTDCGGPTPECSPTTQTCVGCFEHAQCNGATPACDTATGTCVACTDASQCGGATPHCSGNVCVVCGTSDHCPSTTAARCDPSLFTCGACVADADCAHLAATPDCNEGTGTCVPCTPDTEATRCGSNTCNELTFTCTTTPRNSVAICGACVADSDCATNARCANHTNRNERVCLFDTAKVAGACGTNAISRPFTRTLTTTSVDGAAITVCAPFLASCPAVGAYAENRSCLNANDCAGGHCIETGPNAGHCSMVCNSTDNGCAPGHTCSPVGVCERP